MLKGSFKIVGQFLFLSISFVTHQSPLLLSHVREQNRDSFHSSHQEIITELTPQKGTLDSIFSAYVAFTWHHRYVDPSLRFAVNPYDKC